MADLKKLFEEIEKFENKTSWKSSKIKGMRVLEDNNLHIEQEFGTKGEELPYNDNAVLSICKRADVGGGAIHRVSPVLFREHMNEYFKVAPDKFSVINVYDGQIYACHSDNYVVLSVKQLVDIFVSYVKENYENAELFQYYISPTETIVDFILNDEKLNNKYAEVLNRKVGASNRIMPMLRFITSNTGWSGANIIPIIFYKGAFTLTTAPIILKHNGKATPTKFEENCTKAYALMLEGAEKIEELAKVRIDYPANCAANICKELNLPKKLAMPMLLDMEEIYGNMSCTARDVYLYISSMLDTVEEPIRQFKLSDQIARALTLDFKKFDRSKASWLEDSTTARYSSRQTSLFDEVA